MVHRERELAVLVLSNETGRGAAFDYLDHLGSADNQTVNAGNLFG